MISVTKSVFPFTHNLQGRRQARFKNSQPAEAYAVKVSVVFKQSGQKRA